MLPTSSALRSNVSAAMGGPPVGDRIPPARRGIWGPLSGGDHARHRGAPRFTRGATSAGGLAAISRPGHARHRGAPRFTRGATNVGGFGGPFEARLHNA